MKKHAVLLTVLFALIVSSVTVSAVFFEFYKLNKQQYINHIFTKFSIITQIYRAHQQQNSSQIMLEANLAVYKLHILKDKESQKLVLKKGEVLKREGFKSINEALMLNKKGLYTQKLVSDLRATMIQHRKTIYFYIQTKDGAIIIQDEDLKPYKYLNVLYTYATVIAIIAI